MNNLEGNQAFKEACAAKKRREKKKLGKDERGGRKKKNQGYYLERETNLWILSTV